MSSFPPCKVVMLFVLQYPRNKKPFELVDKRQYQMGTVIDISSVKNPDQQGRYKLNEKSKAALKTQFERLLETKKPVVLFLASCWSHRSEISDILRSSGIYSTIRLLEDHGELTEGRFFHLMKAYLTYNLKNLLYLRIFFFGWMIPLMLQY